MCPVHVTPLALIALIFPMQSANNEASHVFFSGLPLRCKYFYYRFSVKHRQFVLLLWRQSLTATGNKVLCFNEVIYFLGTEREEKLGRDSSVGIATRYELDGPGIDSWWGRDFPHPSRPALGPTQPPIQWVPGLSRG
jgi:hypothetical protein